MASALTPAGALIENTAQAVYRIGGSDQHTQSNQHTLRVDEIVRFEVSAVTLGAPGVRPLEQTVYAFDIRNTGNGTVCFTLSAAAVPASETGLDVVSFNIDRDGDGVFNPTIDTPAPASGCGPELAPGQSARIFAVARAPRAMGSDGLARLAIIVRPTVGAGPVGTIFPGAGDGGSDAIAGSPPEAGLITFTATSSRVVVGLEKTQSVAGDASRASAAPGEIIAYALAVQASGDGDVLNAIVNDPLPADLAYVPGSLRLDDHPLSDLPDSDAGEASANLITVRLPDRAAPFVSRITFQAIVRQPTP